MYGLRNRIEGGKGGLLFFFYSSAGRLSHSTLCIFKFTWCLSNPEPSPFNSANCPLMKCEEGYWPFFLTWHLIALSLFYSLHISSFRVTVLSVMEKDLYYSINAGVKFRFKSILYPLPLPTPLPLCHVLVHVVIYPQIPNSETQELS